MSRKPANLTLTQPKCRNCRRLWRPAYGVVADAAYCTKCATERRTVANSSLGLKHITKADLTGPYLLPRKFRAR